MTNLCRSILHFFTATLNPSSTVSFSATGITVILGNHILGEGAFSTVHRASQKSISISSPQQYAVKKVLVQNEETAKSVNMELMCFNQFRHPNILVLIDHVKATNNRGTQVVYLLMPFISRGSLRDELNAVIGGSKRPFSLQEMLRDFSAICSAFNCLHNNKPTKYIHQVSADLMHLHLILILIKYGCLISYIAGRT
jgi:serine/threonine protein kinase